MADIDLVYLWVNGNDPKWIAKHNALIGLPSEAEENCKGRYADNDELKYSLRSVARYAPWLRRIFIVTDGQTPEWLDTTHPKIQIVDHTDIMPAHCLPCFNSVVIEHHLHRIPGLAERFLYANDDMYFNKPVTPQTFYAPDGLPIMRLNRRPFKKTLNALKARFGKPLNAYRQTIHNAALLVEKKFGHYYNGKTHHNIDAYLKSHYAMTRAIFDDDISATLHHHVRSTADIQRNLYTYTALATHCCHLRYVTQHFSFRFHIDNPRQYDKFRRFNPTLFCMNDSQFATNDDRERCARFLSRYFPEKSPFEK